MTSIALQPSELTKAKWSDATSCNGVKQVVPLLFPTYSHIVKFRMKSLKKKKKEEDLLQQMLPKNKHSGKQMYLSCCSCRVRISHGGFQSRFPIENRMVSFFHVASMTSSYSVLSPQAKEEESEAILATARKVSQQHFLHLRSQKRLSWGEFSERDHMLYKLQINIFQKFIKSIN